MKIFLCNLNDKCLSWFILFIFLQFKNENIQSKHLQLSCQLLCEAVLMPTAVNTPLFPSFFLSDTLVVFSFSATGLGLFAQSLLVVLASPLIDCRACLFGTTRQGPDKAKRIKLRLITQVLVSLPLDLIKEELKNYPYIATDGLKFSHFLGIGD